MGVWTEAWGGWYEYRGVKGTISNFSLLITDGNKLSGSGTDNLGEWTWEGESNGAQQVLRKQYVGGKPHSQMFTYTGNRKVSGGREVIQGTWTNTTVPGTGSGPFFLEKLHPALEENFRGYYEQNGSRHTIDSAVLFTTSDKKLFGNGVDDIGPFTWTGELNPTSNGVTLHKLYLNRKTSAEYSGTKSVKDGRTIIQGLSRWGSNYSGGFYLELVDTPWTGWYHQHGKHHNFSASLDLTGSKLSGYGSDDLGHFTWEGETVSHVQVVLRKKYDNGKPHADTIALVGNRFAKACKDVIEGTWTLPTETGLFHMETCIDPVPMPTLPLPGIPVSIRATANPDAYLRLDSAGAVILQLGRSSNESFELVLQEVVGREPVFAIKTTRCKRYLRLDPTESAAQAPAPGATFHPKGVGFTEVVKEVDAQCKFTVVPNNVTVDGVRSFSLKMLNPGTAFDEVFLRLDTDKLSGSEGGEVNGQTYIGRFERLFIEPFVLG